MTCECGNDKFVNISSKTSDANYITFGDIEKEGYVPYDLGIGGGDYLRISFCISCGKIQGFTPLTEEEVKEGILG